MLKPPHKLVALQGTLIDTSEVGGDNCRTTVYIRLQDAGKADGFCGREFAMTYGDHIKDVVEVGERLGIAVVV